MLNIGCHVSSSFGYVKMLEDTIYIGGNTFQWFTRNPRGGAAKELDMDDLNKFLKLRDENGFGLILAHAPYTLNAASDKEETRDFAREVFKYDLDILEKIPGSMYNFHPGSHKGQGIDKGIELISEILNEIMSENQKTIILLETMAGKGTEIGSSFNEIRKIIDNVKYKDKIGVCLDTCHVHDAGYDIVNNLDGVLKEFDEVIGLNYLKAIHLNDSMNCLGSHKDRHEKIGKGYIGLDAIKKIINHPSLKHLPFFLETPNELDGYKDEISLLKSIYNE